MTAPHRTRCICALLLLLAAGCGGETLLGADTVPPGDGGSAMDGAASGDGTLTGEGAQNEDGASLDEQLDASVAALCSHYAQFSCWEDAVQRAMSADGATSCEAELRSEYWRQCETEWGAWAQCIVGQPADCARCTPDDCSGCPVVGCSNPDALCHEQEAAWAACVTSITTLPPTSATSGRASCQGTGNAEGCVLDCYVNDPVSMLSVLCDPTLGGALRCVCEGVDGSGSTPLVDPGFAPPGVRGDFVVLTCQDAAQAVVDGRCTALLDCCFQGKENCNSNGNPNGPCERDCACVGDPKNYGAASCDDLAKLNDATVIPYCLTPISWHPEFKYPASACTNAPAPTPFLGAQGGIACLEESPEAGTSPCHVYYQSFGDGGCGPCDLGKSAPTFEGCACELEQLAGDEGESCRNDENPVSGDGWCYIDPSHGLGSSALLQVCPAGAQGRIRFVGAAASFNSDPNWFLRCDANAADGGCSGGQ